MGRLLPRRVCTASKNKNTLTKTQRCFVAQKNLVHRLRGVNGYMVSYVSWCQGFHGFIGFVVSMVS